MGTKQDSQKKARKSMKGVPRVTDKVIAMSDEDRAKWLAEKTAGLSAEVAAEVKARLEKALTEGREPKKVNFSTIFKGRTVAELTEAQTALTDALAQAETAELDELNRIIAQAEQQKAAIEAAKASKEAASVA